jgi:DNA modification methylase/superfamily II DNA or RNA helicase
MQDHYQDFIANKRTAVIPTGMEPLPVNELLFDFQKDIVRWALRRGRSAIFADCGMGKTAMQLEWARQVHAHTQEPVLILAPLAVASQTVAEGAKFGIEVKHVVNASQVVNGVNVTNYEKLHHFSASDFAGVVLDESSILKSFAGKMRTMIIDAFRDTPFKLACTATPSPNDHTELGNHAEFVGVMLRHEMLATFFVHDAANTQDWRLKGHAVTEFWKWVAQWAVSIAHPSDLGYEMHSFTLPELRISEHIIAVDHSESNGSLFRMGALTLSEVRAEQKATVSIRCAQVAELVDNANPWLIWCHRNDEAAELMRLIPGAVEVSGSDSEDQKSEKMLGFSSGKYRILITKPSIAGFGMNWQHCAHMAFVGLSYSYEQFYQAVRRCWRFGQSREVACHVVVAETEQSVLTAIKRKQGDADEMHVRMIGAMREVSIQAVRGSIVKEEDEYARDVAQGRNWKLHLGDCVEVAKELEDESIDFSVFSPPFSSLYTYSNSTRDMGNSSNDEEFFTHFGFLIEELFRTMKPGRICAVHCMNLTTTKMRDGEIGMRDFRGEIIRAFQARGWTYHSEVTIWKCPVTAMQRTKAHGLLYKTLRTDAARSRQGMPDYLVIFRKPGDNPKPVTNTPDTFSLDDWQDYASPVWMDIDQGDVLTNYREAREHDDERHICPLQLGVIERALKLWSAKDDLVFSPFTGIGSEGYQSLKMGRRFVGAELKRSYFEQAVHNLTRAELPDPQLSLLG